MVVFFVCANYIIDNLNLERTGLFFQKFDSFPDISKVPIMTSTETRQKANESQINNKNESSFFSLDDDKLSMARFYDSILYITVFIVEIIAKFSPPGNSLSVSFKKQ